MAEDLLSRFDDYSSIGGAGGGLGGLEGQRRERSLGRGVNPFGDVVVEGGTYRQQSQEKPVERKAQDYPILRRQDITRIRIPSHITHVAVSNNLLTVAVLGNTIYRFDIKEAKPPEMCEIKRDDDVRIHKMFQDPRSHHLLVCMESKEMYHIARGGVKKTQPRLQPKVKGHLVESVAWNKHETSEHSTGAILLGTNNGVICEAQVDPKKNYCTELYQLMPDMTGSAESVTGLLMEPFPKHDNKWYILATTPCRVYQFIGLINPRNEPQFMELFSFYNDQVKVQFQEIPGSLKDSKLCVWPPHSPEPPIAFAWLTGAGVYYSTLVFGDQQPGETLFLEKNLIPYSAVAETGEDIVIEWDQADLVLPIGLALTKFHCVLLYRDKIVAICHLNNKKVFEEPFNTRRNGPLLAMSTDPVTRNIWTNAKMNLMMYSPHAESRNVWKIYLDQEKFDLAQKYAADDQQNLDSILIRQAEHYFTQGRYEDAAIVFSRSRLSFEQVTLKFMQINKKEALKLFLRRKLDSLSPKDLTQRTMLSTWLTELYLNELGNLNDERNMEAYLRLQKEFHDFLDRPELKQCFSDNSRTIYDLMASHGSTDDIIYFAKTMRDYDKVITHYIQQYKYEDALDILTDQAAIALKHPEKSERKILFQKFAGFYYKFSPVFVKHIPMKTVQSWIKAGKYLDPKKLIPSLIQPRQTDEALQDEQNAAAIIYLEHCVNSLQSEVMSVHNFLISSYANSKEGTDHRKLREYLINQSKSGFAPLYDPHYALRLCLDNGRLNIPCVYIYSAMGLYEESVSLALKCNEVNLARTIINENAMVRKDTQLQKKLWLMIAQHVIKEKKDIKGAMQFLKDCSVLKIEDILPFFSDVVTIDQFKDAICDSLQEYNSHIEQLKKEMQGATESARNIRSDIQEIRNKSVLIKSSQKCNVCQGRLLSRAFYMFPCHHTFHRDCLTDVIASTLSANETRRMNSLIHLAEESRDLKEREASKHQLDQLIANDCPYCGMKMIWSISLPLIPISDLDQLIESWN